jgi:dipeptide/tripeptide permease
MQVENVFRLAAGSVFLMFIGVLIFFTEPRRVPGEQQTTSLGQVVRNLLTVLRNGKFVLFLLIFTGYWIVFWQQYLILPIYIHDYVDPHANTEMILIADPIVVITLTVAVNALLRKISSFGAVTLGTLITGVGWLVFGAHAAVWTAVVSLVIVALGEITQQPRYYEYISRLAPPGQQGTYLGFAFLPIGLGSLIGGRFGGFLLHHFGEVQHRPERIWWTVTAVGLVTTAALWIYDKVLNISGTSSDGRDLGV